jgi:hypothetical protein
LSKLNDIRDWVDTQLSDFELTPDQWLKLGDMLKEVCKWKASNDDDDD